MIEASSYRSLYPDNKQLSSSDLSHTHARTWVYMYLTIRYVKGDMINRAGQPTRVVARRLQEFEVKLHGKLSPSKRR